MTNALGTPDYRRRESIAGTSPALSEATTCAPDASPRSVKESLNALSGTPLSPSDAWDVESISRLRAFQSAERLPATGIADTATVARLAQRVSMLETDGAGESARLEPMSHETVASASFETLSPLAEARARAQLEPLLESFLHAAKEVGETQLQDGPVRLRYIAECGENAQLIMKRVVSGELSPNEGCFIASQLRNDALAAARGDVSEFGLAVSKALKESGKPASELFKSYATKMFGKAPTALTESEGAAVMLKIVERSGVTNKTVNALAKLGPTAGRACIGLSIAIAVYHITKADDKVGETIKQGAAFAGGVAGFKVGGIAGGMLCGPLCAIGGGILGAMIGAYAAEHAAERGVHYWRG